MRSVILTLSLMALCGLAWATTAAQTPPNTTPVESAPRACPVAKSGKPRIPVTTVNATMRVTLAQTQDPPPVPPVRPAPQVHPKPKPNKAKVKIIVPPPVEDEGPEADEDPEVDEPVQSEQTVPTTSTVIVSFCGGTSTVTIRGWDRNEVHARVDGGESVDLKSFSIGDERAPASKIEVLIGSVGARRRERGGMCHSTGDLSLDVPRGAVVDLRTNQGDVDAENIARFRAQSMSGSITLRNITRSVDANAFNGDITVEKTKGPVALSSISGTIDVRDAEQSDPGDALDIKSISGDVSVSNAKFGRVGASTVSGDVNWTGALSNGGQYKFSNTNGDITLVMPATSSFRVNAQTATGGAVSTDFLLRSQGDTSFEKIAQNVRGVYGTGSAQLELTTFNGTIRLRKK